MRRRGRYRGARAAAATGRGRFHRERSSACRRHRRSCPPRSRRGRPPGSATGSRASSCPSCTWRWTAACRCTSSITCCSGSTRTCRSACTHCARGSARRAFAGMPLLLLQVESAGEVAFSRDAPGHVVALHLQAGEGIQVREHQFLAATQNIEYDYSRMKGFANMVFGGGFFIDQFMCTSGEGVVWVHGYGNVFEKTLEAGRVDRHRARRLALLRPLGTDEPGGLWLQDGLPQRCRQPRLQPLHRSWPDRAAERLLPPARSRNRRRWRPGAVRPGSADCLAGCWTTSGPSRR